MNILKTYFESVFLLETPLFADERGSFAVTFEAEAAAELGLPRVFVQDNHSSSRLAGTVRGLHLQLPPRGQGKLVRVLAGRIFDAFVDLRPGSPSRGQYDTLELDATENQLLWIPSGFAHGFCTLEPETEVFYKVDSRYCPDAEISMAWDDPSIGIDWPLAEGTAVLSEKDRHGFEFGSVTREVDSRSRHSASQVIELTSTKTLSNNSRKVSDGHYR